MLHIIGTAGHVDHGKTALIEALTGINADRLPEEKSRGMTIDLGFAHFEGPDGNPVGVIDVPGHERFIRNMVAGAWSLSCALLVIAGDEGWMQQTEDHARVLKAMGIPEIVCVISKIDTIEKDILQYVTEIAEENCTRIFNKEINSIPVSSTTGEGIDILRSVLFDIVQSLPDKKFDGPGFVHIDRVFTIKGSGTVITGSLSGGKLSEGEEITILPKGITTKIRGIQSYYSAVSTAYPVSRVACNLQGVKKEDISRGCIAAAAPAKFWTEKEFIVQWEESDKDRKSIKNHMELECASGTGHTIGTIHFLRTPGFARIVLKEPIAVSWLDSFLLIRQGGHHILGKGMFIWAGKTDRHFRIRLSSILKQYPVPESMQEESVLQFLLNEWLVFTSDSEREAVESFAKAEKLKTRLVKDSIVLEKRFAKELDALKRLASRPGGVSKAEFFQSLALPGVIKERLLEEGLKTNTVVQNDQILINPEQLDGEASLSPLAKKLLDRLTESQSKGLQLKEIPEPGAKKELRNLARIEKVVALEGDIYFSTENFNALAGSVMEGLSSGSTFSIPEAKDKTGLSRKYIIPLLNKMEEKGMVKREGDSRVVR